MLMVKGCLSCSFNNKHEKNARRFGIDKFKTCLLLMVKKTKATLKHIVTLIHLQKLKIGKAGITEGIVNGIHERWRRTVLVKIVYEDLSRLNMRICLFFCCNDPSSV